MAGFMVKQIVGSKIGGFKGELGKLTGDGEGDKAHPTQEEDPEVVEARLEAEERRKEKHRKQETEREKMRQGIREKYNIQKKDDQQSTLIEPDAPGRIGSSKKKSPEELAKEMNTDDDDSLMGQLNGMMAKTKATVSGLTDSVKGFLPFGK